MILSYPEHRQIAIAEKHQHEGIEYITKEEWLRLVHFNEVDIPSMSSEEIPRRIAALRSIEDSPHFLFNWDLKNDPKFMEDVALVFDTTLNGHAGGKIYMLEKYLAGIAAKAISNRT